MRIREVKKVNFTVNKTLFSVVKWTQTE